MMTWNRSLFLLINASATPDPLTVLAARFVAADAIYLVMALLVGLWVWGKPGSRAALLSTALGTVAALGFNQVLGMLWFEPRPFMIQLGHTLIAHAPDNAFPSDHGAFMWGIGFGLIATGASERWGSIVALAGLAVAWARIYLGVHFPIDMVAATLTALVGAMIARVARPLVQRWLLPVAETVYQAALRTLHLSPIIFPRR